MGERTLPNKTRDFPGTPVRPPQEIAHPVEPFALTSRGERNFLGTRVKAQKKRAYRSG